MTSLATRTLQVKSTIYKILSILYHRTHYAHDMFLTNSLLVASSSLGDEFNKLIMYQSQFQEELLL